MAAHEAASARRRRERRLRLFLRHERMAVALHLAEALHHSSGASLEPVVERREEEVEAEVVYVSQEQPPPGMRPGSLSDPGPPQQVAATVGYVAAGAPRLTPVVLVQDAALDDKTIPWLLKRSLAERQREEEEAVEAAVLAELEVKVAVAEDRLLVDLQREREDGTRISRETWATLSHVEQLAVEWYLVKDVLVKRRVKRKKKKRRRTRRRRRWLVDVFSSRPCISQSLV